MENVLLRITTSSYVGEKYNDERRRIFTFIFYESKVCLCQEKEGEINGQPLRANTISSSAPYEEEPPR